MSDSSSQSTGIEYWRASETGAQTANCSVTFDVDTPSSGWFEFRNDGVERTIYHDTGSVYDGVVADFNGSLCSTANMTASTDEFE
jgi:hypothetical protein